jgi:hypothetical protein
VRAPEINASCAQLSTFPRIEAASVRIASPEASPNMGAMAYALGHVRLRWGLAAVFAIVLLIGLVVLAQGTGSAGPPRVQPAVRSSAPGAQVSVGPGPVRSSLRTGNYRVDVRYSPNRPASAGSFSLQLFRQGRPVDGARVRLTTMMLTMDMGYTGLLVQKGFGRYVHLWPPLGMSGRWRLQFEIMPPRAKSFAVTLIDRLR